MGNDYGQASSFVAPQLNAPRTMAKVQKAEGADGDHCINSSGINAIAFMVRDTGIKRRGGGRGGREGLVTTY